MDPSLGLLLVLYIMCCGFAVLVYGKKGFVIFNKWLLKKFRNILGGIFSWAGKKIKGA